MAIKTSNKYFIPVITLLLALLSAMPPFAIDTYLSAMPAMSIYFGVGINMVEISLTLYYLGFALGYLVGGPLSDSFGRKNIALTGIFLYGVTALIIPFCPRIEYVWILRVFQAFGGGFAAVTPMLFVRDWFEGKQLARLATIVSMISMLAPLFAPVIGSAFLELGSWQSIFYFLAVFAILIFVLFSTVIPESREKNLLTKKLSSRQFLNNYKLFFSDKRAVFILLSISLPGAGMFAFLTGASFIYIEYFGFKPSVFPLLFGSNIVLNIGLSFLNTILLKRKEPGDIMKFGMYLQLLAGAILLVAGLFLESPFILVFIAIVLFIGSLGIITGNGTVVALNIMPHISGSANATIGVSTFLFGFIAGSLSALFYTGNLVPISIVMFSCTLLANISFFFFRRLLAKADNNGHIRQPGLKES
jgi:DHA1 family bicyclomycin/chloramphenicol resistance-like MFS transporter